MCPAPARRVPRKPGMRLIPPGPAGRGDPRHHSVGFGGVTVVQSSSMGSRRSRMRSGSTTAMAALIRSCSTTGRAWTTSSVAPCTPSARTCVASWPGSTSRSVTRSGDALVCLLGLNGLRASEACSPNVGDRGGARHQPTLRIVGKGDTPAEDPAQPAHTRGDRPGARRTHRRAAAAQPVGDRMQRHDAAIVTRLARRIGIERRVTPHGCAGPTSPSGCSRACRCARCNAPPGTPELTRRSPTTSPTARSTATRPSSS